MVVIVNNALLSGSWLPVEGGLHASTGSTVVGKGLDVNCISIKSICNCNFMLQLLLAFLW